MTAPASLAPKTGASALRVLLRCPRCGKPLSWQAETVICDEGHASPCVHGVPCLVRAVWEGEQAELNRRTSAFFGDQWTRLGEDARVDMDDLLLHLPAGWSAGVFSGVVLDAGCGAGRYTALVAQCGAAAIGMDVSESVLAASRVWPEAAFVQADLAAPPFAPATFDVVYSFGVLHHLPDPIRGLSACFELVKPGGVLLAWVYSDHGGIFRRARVTVRRLVRRVPVLLEPAAGAAAVALALSQRLDSRRLTFYRGRSLRQIYVDCHDALAAPVEVYLSEDDCRAWLSMLPAREAGAERRRDGSGWILWARRA